MTTSMKRRHYALPRGIPAFSERAGKRNPPDAPKGVNRASVKKKDSFTDLVNEI